MIMTKTKTRDIRRAASILPADGDYTVTASFDADEIIRSDADYVVMGMIVPAEKAESLRSLIDSESGLVSSPMLLLKKSEDGSSSQTIRSRFGSDSHSPDEASDISLNEIEIIPGRHEVKVNGELIVLTFSEFRILQTLAGKPGWVFSREQLIYAIHGDNYNCTERAIDVQVTGLRKKLGDAGHYVETVRGVGYRFSE